MIWSPSILAYATCAMTSLLVNRTTRRYLGVLYLFLD